MCSCWGLMPTNHNLMKILSSFQGHYLQLFDPHWQSGHELIHGAVVNHELLVQ